ncbi:MAG: PTS sugar transporter subunit IIC, partial [Lachnospiraceae bacterium]|nr:PTS sugar transporter subunit IIC [Lachnospiraceae bacterium]
LGEPVVNLIKTSLPMDGIPMKTLFTVGALLPCVGIAILLKQIVRSVLDFVPYLFGFTLAASMGLNLVSATVVAAMFAILIYNLKMLQLKKAAPAATNASGNNWDDDEEDI